jgi:hypothetical protein
MAARLWVLIAIHLPIFKELLDVYEPWPEEGESAAEQDAQAIPPTEVWRSTQPQSMLASARQDADAETDSDDEPEEAAESTTKASASPARGPVHPPQQAIPVAHSAEPEDGNNSDGDNEEDEEEEDGDAEEDIHYGMDCYIDRSFLSSLPASMRHHHLAGYGFARADFDPRFRAMMGLDEEEEESSGNPATAAAAATAAATASAASPTATPSEPTESSSLSLLAKLDQLLVEEAEQERQGTDCLSDQAQREAIAALHATAPPGARTVKVPVRHSAGPAVRRNATAAAGTPPGQSDRLTPADVDALQPPNTAAGIPDRKRVSFAADLEQGPTARSPGTTEPAPILKPFQQPPAVAGPRAAPDTTPTSSATGPVPLGARVRERSGPRRAEGGPSVLQATVKERVRTAATADPATTERLLLQREVRMVYGWLVGGDREAARTEMAVLRSCMPPRRKAGSGCSST